jgi:hypothetical protein
MEIETHIYCETCKSFCHLKLIEGVEYVKCNCGSLDLMLEEKFIDN